VQAGRSLLQQGPPVTFGLTVAGWLTGLDAAADRLRGLRFAVQFGGAVGTLASLGAHGPVVRTALARRLDLPEPALPWHTERTRIAELASALGEVCGVVGKICGDVTLLATTELAEVTEEGPAGSGGSSTMPHKRNPVAAVTALAAARQAPGLVAGLLGAMVQEHQRAAGAWQAEWRQLTDLLRLTGAAAHWLRTCVERLRVHEDAMRANLDRTGGLAIAERVTSELAPVIGRLRAHNAVTAACGRVAAGEGTLAEVLAADPLLGAHLDRERIAALLDPTGYLGSAGTFVDAALAAHRERTG
jgi:3-carboxy-cis,cis-muconate cycloisomerase